MADRAHVLGLLQCELRAAEDAHADVYAAELRGRIALLSAGSPHNPAAETLASPATRRPAARRAVK